MILKRFSGEIFSALFLLFLTTASFAVASPDHNNQREQKDELRKELGEITPYVPLAAACDGQAALISEVTGLRVKAKDELPLPLAEAAIMQAAGLTYSAENLRSKLGALEDAAFWRLVTALDKPDSTKPAVTEIIKRKGSVVLEKIEALLRELNRDLLKEVLGLSATLGSSLQSKPRLHPLFQLKPDSLVGYRISGGSFSRDGKWVLGFPEKDETLNRLHSSYLLVANGINGSSQELLLWDSEEKGLRFFDWVDVSNSGDTLKGFGIYKRDTASQGSPYHIAYHKHSSGMGYDEGIASTRTTRPFYTLIHEDHVSLISFKDRKVKAVSTYNSPVTHAVYDSSRRTLVTAHKDLSLRAVELTLIQGSDRYDCGEAKFLMQPYSIIGEIVKLEYSPKYSNLMVVRRKNILSKPVRPSAKVAQQTDVIPLQKQLRYDMEIEVWAGAGLTPLVTHRLPNRLYESPEFATLFDTSMTGMLLHVDEGVIHETDSLTGQVRTFHERFPLPVGQFKVSLTGKYIALTDALLGNVHIVRVWNVAGELVGTLFTDAKVLSLDFSPDENRLLIADPFKLQVFEIKEAEAPTH